MKKDWTVTLSVKENLESLLLSLLCLLKSGVVHVVHRNGQGEANCAAVDHRRMEEQARACVQFPSGNDERN